MFSITGDFICHIAHTFHSLLLLCLFLFFSFFIWLKLCFTIEIELSWIELNWRQNEPYMVLVYVYFNLFRFLQILYIFMIIKKYINNFISWPCISPSAVLNTTGVYEEIYILKSLQCLWNLKSDCTLTRLCAIRFYLSTLCKLYFCIFFYLRTCRNTHTMRIRTDPRIYEIHTSTYLFFAIPWIAPKSS